MVHVVWALRKRLKDLLEVYTMEQDVMDNQSGWSNNKRKLGKSDGKIHHILEDPFLHSLMEELDLENTTSSQTHLKEELFYKFNNHYILI